MFFQNRSRGPFLEGPGAYLSSTGRFWCHFEFRDFQKGTFWAPFSPKGRPKTQSPEFRFTLWGRHFRERPSKTDFYFSLFLDHSGPLFGGFCTFPLLFGAIFRIFCIDFTTLDAATSRPSITPAQRNARKRLNPPPPSVGDHGVSNHEYIKFCQTPSLVLPRHPRAFRRATTRRPPRPPKRPNIQHFYQFWTGLNLNKNRSPRKTIKKRKTTTHGRPKARSLWLFDSILVLVFDAFSRSTETL